MAVDSQQVARSGGGPSVSVVNNEPESEVCSALVDLIHDDITRISGSMVSIVISQALVGRKHSLVHSQFGEYFIFFCALSKSAPKMWVSPHRVFE